MQETPCPPAIYSDGGKALWSRLEIGSLKGITGADIGIVANYKTGFVNAVTAIYVREHFPIVHLLNDPIAAINHMNRDNMCSRLGQEWQSNPTGFFNYEASVGNFGTMKDVAYFPFRHLVKGIGTQKLTPDGVNYDFGGISGNNRDSGIVSHVLKLQQEKSFQKLLHGSSIKKPMTPEDTTLQLQYDNTVCGKKLEHKLTMGKSYEIGHHVVIVAVCTDEMGQQMLKYSIANKPGAAYDNDFHVCRDISFLEFARLAQPALEKRQQELTTAQA